MWILGMIAAAASLPPLLAAAEETDEPPPPVPISRLADEIEKHEAAIRQVEAEIAVVQQGRLADVLKAIAAAKKAITAAQTQLDALTAGVRKRVADKYNREYNERKRRYENAVRDLRNRRDNDLRRWNSENDPDYRERRRIRRQYDSDKDREEDRYRRDVREIKRRYDREVADELRKIADQVKQKESDLRAAKAEVVRQTSLRRKVSAELIGLRKKISSHRRELVTIRRQVSERAEEAWAAGLRPRNGRYVLDEQTGRISVVGGLWGRPRETDDWTRSNRMQAADLLALAGKMKKADKTDLCRKCLQRLIEDFPDSTYATKAQEMLDAAGK